MSIKHRLGTCLSFINLVCQGSTTDGAPPGQEGAHLRVQPGEADPGGDRGDSAPAPPRFLLHRQGMVIYPPP